MEAFLKIIIKFTIIFQHLMQKNANNSLDKSLKTTDNTSVACNNFYQYACSNYSRENPDPNYSEITQKLDYELNKKLLEHLQQQPFNKQFKDDEQQTYYDKLLMYWQSCIYETRRNLRKYFEEIRPSKKLNWPLLEAKESWLEEEDIFDFWSLLGQIQGHGLNDIIIKQEIIRNKNNTLDIWLAPAMITEQGSLPEHTILKVFLMALNVTKDVEVIIEQLKLTDIKWQEINNNSDLITIKEVTLRDLAELYPNINLHSYLEQLLGSQELENISRITIENLEYFEFLNQKFWSREELEQLSNYLMMKFLYYLAVDGTSEFTPLECIEDLRNKFDLAVNYVYYKHYFKNEETKFKYPLIQMLYKIQNTMIEYFKDNNLKLSSQQIQYLIEKLEAVKVNIGNLPDNYYNNENIIETFYQAIPNLDADNYYKNHLLLLKHRFRNTLIYTQNQSHFIVTDNHLGSQSSPFYVAQQNMVVIPFGSLQIPLYYYKQNPLQQLSLLGFVLGHELTHVVDTSGMQFDQFGVPTTLYSNIINHAQFSKSLECMQEQEPTESIDERIADIFAIRVVYRCYEKYYAEDQNDWQKDFFVHMAQFFCGKNDIDFIDHDSDTIRLQQIIKNFPPFAKTFECVEESAMNPKDKCRLY